MWEEKRIFDQRSTSALRLVVTFSDFVDLGKMYVLDVPSRISAMLLVKDGPLALRLLLLSTEAVERIFSPSCS